MKSTDIYPTPTEEQFLALNGAYSYFNQKLFNGILPGCILNFSRKKNTHGFLAPYRWKRTGENKFSTHEISLTPSTLYRIPQKVFSTLVHEQVHLWQFEFGEPSRSGYHNREWADKMIEIGLIPSHNGQVGGKQTGQRITHYILDGGRYQRAFNEMPKQYVLPFTSLEGEIRRKELTSFSLRMKKVTGPNGVKKPIPKSRNKTKYSCPLCKTNIWGKPNLNIICGDCEKAFKVNKG